MEFSKAIDLEDFESKELMPYLSLIAEEEKAFFGMKDPFIIPDSKNWETAMALYSFEKNDLLKEGKLFAGIGAGTERLTELLANRGCIVFPIDRYLEMTPWSDVAPSSYMISASEHAPRCLHPKNILPVHCDARALNLPSGFFDGVYSSGSIEHFGGLDAVEAAAYEIARVLKPGGIASISTEFFLDGPHGQPWFDDNCILFTPDLLRKHIVEPSGLTPIGIPHNRPSANTFKTRKNLSDFLLSAKNTQTFDNKLDAYPNLILFHEGFLFCSVHFLLKKPLDWKPSSSLESKVGHFSKEVQCNNRVAMEKLKRGLTGPTPAPLTVREVESSSRKKTWSARALSYVNSRLKKTPRLRYLLLRLLLLFPGLALRLRRKFKDYGIAP